MTCSISPRKNIKHTFDLLTFNKKGPENRVCFFIGDGEIRTLCSFHKVVGGAVLAVAVEEWVFGGEDDLDYEPIF
jgi:hypothetical protein